MDDKRPAPAEGISSKQRKLLELMLQERRRAQQDAPPIKATIPVRSPSDLPILSFAQQRLWFIQQFQPGTAAYNIPSGVRLLGPLSASRFEQALNETVRRHETLRSTFAMVDGRPLQLVAPRRSVSLPRIDLRHLPPERREPEAQRLVNGLARSPFDMAAAPPWRSALVQLQDDEHVFLIVMHHIISDTWTTGVFFREIVGHYKALFEGRPAAVPELPVQYADYAVWQARELQEAGLRRQLAYWQKQFEDAPPLLALPTDRPRPAVPSFRGGRITLVLPTQLANRLKGLSAEADATLFMTLMGSYQTLLLRFTGQDDILVGTPMANRTRVELENLIGVFVNTLVLRTSFAGSPSFRQVLARVREATLEGLSHHDVPFERVVESLGLERDTSRNPLFQALFAFQNVPIPKLLAEGLTLERFEFQETTARLDVELDLQEMPYGFVGWIGYNADLFEEATMGRWARSFLLLLEGIAEQPDVPLAELPLLAPEERHQIVAGWNDTRTPYERDATIHGLVDRQAARTPDAVAVEDGDLRLTYAELLRQAHRLAHHLRTLGIGLDTRVGVHLERGAHDLVALLGILAAGGAYVPLDISWPTGRLETLLDLGGITHLITQTSRLSTVEDLAPCLDHAVLLDPPRAVPAAAPATVGHCRLWTGRALKAQPATAPAVRVPPEALAYVIFTSGSTGTPKGVMVCHRPVINLFEWVNGTFGVGPGDRLLFLTSLGFDLSVYDIFGILTAGGTVRVAADAEVRQPEALARILVHEPITFWDSAPAALQQIAPLLPAEPQAGHPLRRVFLSGDWIPVSLPDRVRAAFPAAQVISLGGATEAVVWSNVYPIGTVEPWWASIPYGRPIQNARYHVLDARLEPVPVGVQGDLCIGGECLAMGYLGDPELTARKFMPDPHGGVPGARLYATGDRTRYWADGNLEFQGRLDHQVKIRGYRIEMGEIESLLARHPAIREVALLAPGTGSDRRLVAYVVPRPGEAPTTSELRAWLQERLPDYMVPSVFMTLEALPVTANGKLDRKALPAPDGERPVLESAYVEVRGGIEQSIAEIWSRVLGVARVGRNDNFFELGGHSMLLTQVHRELLATAPDLTLVDLFTYPTVASLAEHLSAKTGKRSAAQEAQERAAARRSSAGAERETDIAIVGMALRFPGASDTRQFWENLRNGVESISFFTRDQVIAAGVPPEQADHPDYVRAEGDIEDVDLFEPDFFGLNNQAEVEMLDPQQRLFMECAWEALEDAGYAPERYPGVIGIFGGMNISSYLFSNLYDHDPLNVMSSFLTRIGLLVGNQNDYICTRVAYHFNLRGPSITVQTACSTATVAAHLACQSLMRHECDMCLAGGSQIRVPQQMGYLYQEGGFPSPDGHCRSFDARGKGNVHGNGVGVVLLKRLSDALREGDHVYAVIKGSAACNDGIVKVGFTAPGVDGQVRAAAEALTVSGVHPESIGYLEATGTATELGDPIEIEALTRAYRLGTQTSAYCPIGSVKSNIGHLDAASGAAALIKTALALQHEEIPASLHFEEPNPRIDFANSPFFVNAKLRPWPRGEQPRRAAVHTYAVGGTNTHIILEESPRTAPGGPSRPWQLLLLSARSTSALHAATLRLKRHLEDHPGADLADVAHTLQVGRRELAVRRAILCRDVADTLARLDDLDPAWVKTDLLPDDRPAVAFSFPGSAALEGASELYAAEPAFRVEIDRGAGLLAPSLGVDVRALLSDPRQLREPRIAEPVLVLAEHALTRLWAEWGVTPQAVAGEGAGEYAAACVAGTLSLEDALALAVARGSALAELPSGARLEVHRPAAEVRELIGPELVLEGGARAVCRVAGPKAAIDDLQARLNDEGIDCFHLGSGPLAPADHPALQSFRRTVERLAFRPLSLPLLDRRTGAPVNAAELAQPERWVRCLIANLMDEGALQTDERLWLEMAPAPADALADRQTAHLLGQLAHLWLAGAPIDWSGFSQHERRLRVSLPTYPFERRRIWAQPQLDRQQALGLRRDPGARLPLDEWFYAPSWKRAEQPARTSTLPTDHTWMLIGDSPLGDLLAANLRLRGVDTLVVRVGERFAADGDGEARIDPGQPADYERLLAHLRDAGRRVGTVVHIWGVTPGGDADGEGLQDICFWSLAHLARALAGSGNERVRIEIVTAGAQEVTGEERVNPAMAACLACARVVPREYPHLTCRALDVVPLEPGGERERRLVDALLAELARTPSAKVLALRGDRWWVESFERLDLPAPAALPVLLRPNGVYLLVGESGFGLLTAAYLARAAQARLVLVGDLGLPERESWDAWLIGASSGDETAERIRGLRQLEEAGAELLIVEADVTHPGQMRQAVERALQRFGELHGVFYATCQQGPEFARSLAEVDPDFYEYRLRSRLGGLDALREALHGSAPDFVLLASTVASVLGGQRVVVDCLADTFLDLFARRESRQGVTPWISVDWDAFGLPGQAGAIAPDEGSQALARLLAAEGLPQIVVSTTDLEARVAMVRRGRSAAGAGEDRPEGRERPALRTPYVAPRNDLEAQVAEIWQEVLGIDRVGLDDDLFDLGGNSLVATQLVSRLRGALQVNLALHDFFAGATVAAVAEQIKVARWAVGGMAGAPATAVLEEMGEI